MLFILITSHLSFDYSSDSIYAMFIRSSLHYVVPWPIGATWNFLYPGWRRRCFYAPLITCDGYLLLFGDHPLTLSLQAKPSFPKILPTAALHFFFLNIHYMDSPGCLLLFLSISVFYF